MLGIEDTTILAGYALSLGVTLVCVIYGWRKREQGEEHSG